MVGCKANQLAQADFFACQDLPIDKSMNGLREVCMGNTLRSEKIVIRSVYESQSEILKAIIKLHCPDGFECDVTYGNGQFYKDVKKPKLKFDIDPQEAGVKKASSDKLPLDQNSIGNIVFDPPFLTYVREGRIGNGKMIMAKRFAGYWRYDELEAHYRGTLKEARRCLRDFGVMVFKCQDIVHNHKLHCTHANVINWAAEEGFRLMDLFIMPASHRLPSPNRAGAQKHARIFHSYFLVFLSMPASKRKAGSALIKKKSHAPATQPLVNNG